MRLICPIMPSMQSDHNIINIIPGTIVLLIFHPPENLNATFNRTPCHLLQKAKVVILFSAQYINALIFTSSLFIFLISTLRRTQWVLNLGPLPLPVFMGGGRVILSKRPSFPSYFQYNTVLPTTITSLSSKTLGQLWILNKIIRQVTCICSRSIHTKVTKFYAGNQPITTLLVFLSLGPAVNEVYDTKHWRSFS